jgi:hypothetical protein
VENFFGRHYIKTMTIARLTLRIEHLALGHRPPRYRLATLRDRLLVFLAYLAKFVRFVHTLA